MKPTGFSKKSPIPADPADIEAVVASAPGKDRPLTAREKAKWDTGVLVDGGGYQAVRKAVAAKRKSGQRGPQLAPTKQLVSVRYSPEVLAFFKAEGTGWQTRMDEALKEWVSRRGKAKRRVLPRDA